VTPADTAISAVEAARHARIEAWRRTHTILWESWIAAWRDGGGGTLRCVPVSQAGLRTVVPVTINGEPHALIGSDQRCDLLEPWLQAAAALIGTSLAAEDELNGMTDELVDTYDQLTFLYEIARTLSGTDTLAEALASLLGQARAILGAQGSALIVDRPDKPLLTVMDGDSVGEPFLVALHRTVSANGRPFVANDAVAIRHLIRDAPPSVTSVVAAPIVTPDGTATAICIGATKGIGFTAGNRKLMQALAEQSVAVIARFALQEEQIRRGLMARDLELAAQIQTALLPGPFSPRPGIALSAIMVPASEVGGDFYTHPDSRTGGEGPVALAIGDVAGKGVAAALVTTMCLSAMRTEMRHVTSPARALHAVSGFVAEELSRIDSFVTCILATFDEKTRCLAYANAGHTAILHWSVRTRSLRALGATGLPLGIDIGIPIEDAAVMLDPGDRLIFYTDGVTEAMAADGELFGDARLHALIEYCADGSLLEMQAAILSAIRAFAPVQRDDITLIILQAEDAS
jgi:serine phosphatase RsbU (regulator of sigma subunit)